MRYDKRRGFQKLTEIEWDDFECKAAQDKLPEDVWATVSAFSNTPGGRIVFGINQKGKRFEIQGVNSGEKTESDFLNTLRNGQKFNMRLSAKPKKYNFDGRLVLTIGGILMLGQRDVVQRYVSNFWRRRR